MIYRKIFVEFIHIIWNGIMTVFEWSKMAGLYIAQLEDMIPNAVVSLIMQGVLLVIVCASIIGGLGAFAVVLGKKYFGFFRKIQADSISVYVGLLILAIIVFMADFIKSILSINLFMVALAIFVGYTVVRGIIQAENTDAKKKILKYAGITAGGVSVFMIMVHFFGVIGIIAIPIGCFLCSGEC